jgi:ribokinase
VPAEAVKDAARRAKELGASVVLNAAPRRGEDRELLRSVDVLVVNESEVQDFAGREVHDPESAAAAAAAVLAMGVPAVVVTLGPAGAVAGQGSETFFVKAFGISPVDTTAAGDAFVGALVVALVEGKELRVAAQLGAAAGALAATKPGAQTSLPRRHDLRESFGVDWSSV